jgi:hypothetical protein
LPLRYENTLIARPAASGAASKQDQLLVELGRLASLAFVRDLSGPEPRVLRGSIGCRTGCTGNPHRNPSAVLPQTSIWRA